MIYKIEKVEMRDAESSQRDGVQSMVDDILYSSLLCNCCDCDLNLKRDN